jgi:hypothetical protein
MTTDTMTLQQELEQFIGTEQYHFNPLYRWMNYTDGVKYFATNAGGGAYWLLDIIGTELQPLARKHGFLTVDLLVHDTAKADIVVTDGDYLELWRRHIDWTDCPQGVWKFFLQSGVLMVTSEY